MHEKAQKEELGANLAAARLAAGLSQTEAATKLGIGKAALSAWEVGRNLPDALMLGRVARIYETSADTLLWGDTAPDRKLVEAMRMALRETSTTTRKLPADDNRNTSSEAGNRLTLTKEQRRRRDQLRQTPPRKKA